MEISMVKEKSTNNQNQENFTLATETDKEVNQLISRVKRSLSISSQTEISREETKSPKLERKMNEDNNQNKNWKDINQNFTNELQNEWEEKNFSYEECKEYIDAGLQISDADHAYWLRNVKKVNAEWLLNHGNNEQLRKEYENYSISRWHNKGFTDEEISLWRSVGLELPDGDYAAWLRDIKKINLAEYGNSDDKLLREERKKFLEERKIKTEWNQQGFSYEEVEQWMNIGGLSSNDAEFAKWLKNKQISPEGVLAYRKIDENLDTLRKNYRKDKGINAQEWLDLNYPLDSRNWYYLNISNQNLTRFLSLDGFTNLIELNCSQNQLTSLNLSGCPNLKVLDCYNNQLTNLDLTPFCSSLEALYCCPGNKLTKLDFSKCFNLKDYRIGIYLDVVWPPHFAEKDNEPKFREISEEESELIDKQNQEIQFQTQILQAKLKSLEEELTRTQKQLKEISNIVLPNTAFDFSTLNIEIERLKIESLSHQIQNKKVELERLLIEAKNKLGEESEFLLDILLEVQTTTTGTSKSLESLKFSLSKKLTEEEIEFFCQSQREILRLEQERDNIQKGTKEEDEFKTQIEISPRQ